MKAVRYLRVNGVHSAVYEAGACDSDNVALFVHGNPGPMEDWEDIARDAARFCRVVAVDMPGFGRADHPSVFDFNVGGYGRHLAGLVEQLELSRVHLVLHDFGAAWGARWAVDHPTQLASITLINPLPLLREFRWHLFAKLWQTPLLGELLQSGSGPASIRFIMNHDNPTAFPEAFIERLLRYKDRDQLRAVLMLYRATRDVQELGKLGSALGALDPPACVIWGAADRYAPVAHASAMAGLFTRCELHTLAGLGHWPFIDDPPALSAIVCDFLGRQMPAGTFPSRV